MWIRRLQINNFRGIKSGQIEFSERQTVLVGANGAGKSTILEALALLFGRDRLVRSLTEHDFTGSNPSAADRIRLVATITGFSPNVAANHGQWFSERKAVSKWLNKQGTVLPEADSDDDDLCMQIGFCARFDRNELVVETVRYFHDDDSMADPFDEEVVQLVSTKLLTEIGFFLIPAHRTWDKLVSFNSELFRKILDSSGSLEATEVLAERDRLRLDAHRVDLDGALKGLRDGINAQLKQLLPGEASLELRLTGTDAESLLHALVPHYRYAGSTSLPAGRHGSGLLSLQTALLVLQIAERRRAAKQNVIIVVEEPELHMPPGIQAQILHQLRNASNQLICTTHSPRVAAVCPAVDVRVVNEGRGGGSQISPVLQDPLLPTAKNGVRKLFHESRQEFIESIMHRFVIVPEGRTDVEWLKHFCLCATRDDELGAHSEYLPFGTLFGIAPTHDACVSETIERIREIRDGVTALLDGDAAGDGYAEIAIAGAKPPQYIAQWPLGWVMEDVVGWLLGPEDTLAKRVQSEYAGAPGNLGDLTAWLKTNTNKGGAKTDSLAHEAIFTVLCSSDAAKDKARLLLGSFVQMATGGGETGLLKPDAARSSSLTSVWRFALES